MPAIITRPIPVSKDASSSVIDSGSTTLTHPNVLLGISVGCASLVAVIASIVAWRYLKRHRKNREEMSAPGLVLDGNAIERNEVQCVLNLVPEKDSFTVIPPITSAPIFPQLLFTPALEGMSLSDSDSGSSISNPTEDVLELDDWDFKCRGQPLEDVAGDCDDPYSSQEIVSAEAIQDALTLTSSPPTALFDEDETDRPAKHSADGNLSATTEGDEGNEGSKGKADESMNMCRFESTGIARKDVTEESTEEFNDKSSRHGFEQDLRSKDVTNAMHNGDAKHASVAVGEDLWTMKDFIACESSETEMIGIDIENDALQLIENDAEAGAATDVAVKEIMLSTPASEVESTVGLDSSLEKGSVKEGDNYHFSEVAPIQDFMNNADEKDEDLRAKADDYTVALSLVELDIPMALQMTELHEPGTLPIHSRPSASSELVTNEVGMPIVVSVEGKDDSARFSDFFFNEKCLGKTQRKDVMKAGVRSTEGEKEKFEIDQVPVVCARDVGERHETGALAVASGRVVTHNELSIAPTTSSLASPAISDTIKLGSKSSVDESSHNGQCSPPWWEVLEKIKQDPLGCNGVEMFREWAIKNGIASEHVKQRTKSKPLAKLIKPAPLPMKAGVRKASIPVKDREAIKRDLEKMFREWWAAGNEAILGPLEDGPCVRSDQVNDTSSKLSHRTSSKQDRHSSICNAQDKCIAAMAGVEMDYYKSLGSLIDFPPFETSCKGLDAKKSPVEDDCRGKLDEHHERENFNSSRVLDHILRPSPNSPIKETHEAPITSRNLAGVKSSLSTVARTPVKIAQQKMASSPGPLRRARLYSEAASTPTAKGLKANGSSLKGYLTSSNQSRIAATTSPSKLPVISANPRLPTINHGKFARSPPSSTTCSPSSGSVATVEPSSPRHRSLASPAKPAWNSPTSRNLASSTREERTHRKVDSRRAIAPINRAQTMRTRRASLSPLKPAINDETSMDKENTAPVNGTHAPRRGSSSELSTARRNGSPGCVASKNI